MGKMRLLYDNLITSEDMISVSSLRYGLVTAAVKVGTGSATLNTSGNYSGATDLEYIIEIDAVAAGAEIGQATFRWSDGSGGWNAAGVATSATNITLNNGVTINWTAGAGADFVAGDIWYLKGVNPFNAAKMIDLDRDHRYRSLTLDSPNTITIDLGSAQEFDALAIVDHNLTSAATITLEADDAATFDSDGGSPQVSESVTWTSGTILHYLTAATKRHARCLISDGANPDNHIEVGDLFLGKYLELTNNFIYGGSRPTTALVSRNKTPYGVGAARFYNLQKEFSYTFENLPSADITALEALLEAISDRTTGIIKPVLFNEDSDDLTAVWLVDIEQIPRENTFHQRYASELQMLEVMRSV